MTHIVMTTASLSVAATAQVRSQRQKLVAVSYFFWLCFVYSILGTVAANHSFVIWIVLAGIYIYIPQRSYHAVLSSLVLLLRLHNIYAVIQVTSSVS